MREAAFTSPVLFFAPSLFPSKLDESVQKAMRRSARCFATFPLASGNEVSRSRSGRDTKPTSRGFSLERRTETAIRTVHRTTATSSQPEVHTPEPVKPDRPAPLENKTLSFAS